MSGAPSPLVARMAAALRVLDDAALEDPGERMQRYLLTLDGASSAADIDEFIASDATVAAAERRRRAVERWRGELAEGGVDE
jgi:hypothetical protein